MFDFRYTPRTFDNVTQVMVDELGWDANRVALLMLEHKIRSRAALAKTLGVTRSVVNRSFNQDWSGRATAQLIALLCGYFCVRMSDVVVEPVIMNRRLNKAQLRRVPNRAVS